MSRGLRSPRRIGRSLILSTVIAMLGALFYALPASAVSTCTGAGVTLTVNIDVDDDVALRVAAGTFEFAVNAASDEVAVWVACGGVNTDAAIETILVQNPALSASETYQPVGATLGANATFINLGSGTDTVDIWADDPAGTPVAAQLGLSAGGALVGDLDSDGVADTQFNNAETYRATGGDASDVLDLQGDFDPSPDFSDADALADIPGTPGGAASTSGPGGSAGNFTAPVSFAGGPDVDLFFSGNANDTFQGAAGLDLAIYAECPAGVDVDLAATSSTGGCGDDVLTDVQWAFGSTFTDNLLGSGDDNVLTGNDGDDFLDGRAGNDIIAGEAGDDTVYEGTAASGMDDLSGGTGDEVAGDTLDYGDRTADVSITLAGGAVSGEGGCPLAATCEDDDVADDFENVVTGSGNDTLVAAANDVVWTAGAGNDNFLGGSGIDYFDFSDSAAGIIVDVPAGTATGNGDDTFDADVDGFIGSELDDTFIDDTTADHDYFGAGGNDLFDQGASPSTDSDGFDGGAGTDHINYGARTNDISCDLDFDALLDCGEGGETDDILGTQDDIENLTTGSGNDFLGGNNLANVLDGGLGNDDSSGDEGNDTFPQGAAPDGSDILDGDEGADFVDYGARTGDVRVSLGAGAGNNGEGCVPGSTVDCEGDTIEDVENTNTGAGNDLVLGSFDDNIINTGDGNDKVNPSDGGDILDGGAGRDAVSFETGIGVRVNLKNGTAAEIGSGGGGGLDTLERFENVSGSLRQDIIVGNGKKNRLSGLSGGDIIKGKGGRDNLIGHQGRDNLNGGKGRDRANGGPGNDKCKAEVKISC